jgi:O-antigen/teichoic acid export membrane protein
MASDRETAEIRRGNGLVDSGPGVSPSIARAPAGRPAPPTSRTGAAGASRGGARDKIADVGRGSTLNLFSAAVAAVTTTLITVLITNAFPKAEAGAFFTATSAFIIVNAIAGMGTSIGLTFFIARLRSMGEEKRIPGMVRIAIVPVVLVSVLATLLMIVLAEPLAHLVLRGRADVTGISPGSVALALRGLALMLPFAGLLNAYLGASRGYGDMRPSAWVGQIGLTVGRLIGILVAVAVGASALLAPLWALPYLPTAIIAWLWGRRISRRRAKPPVALPDVPPEVAALLALATPEPLQNGPRSGPGQGSRAMRRHLATFNARGFWAFTTPRAIANVAQNILQQIDIVLVAAMRGPAEAAVYTAATRFLVFGQLGGMAINKASQTRFTELFTIGDHRGVNTVYRTTTGWLVVLLCPLYLLAVAFGPVALTIFGHSYRAGGTVVVILGLAAIVATACGQVDMVLITSGRSSWSLINGLLTVGVNVGLDLFLIPRYGITGAAIGWAVAIVVSNVMPLAQLGKVLGLHPFGRGTIIACALTAVSFGAIPLAIRVALGTNVISLVLAIIAGSVVQAAGLWRFRRVLRLSDIRGYRAPRPAGRPAGAR